MTIRQISVFIENKYGKLSECLALLGEEKIRIVAIMVSDTSEFGILRLVVTDPDKAYKVLKNNNVSVSLTDVFAIVTAPLASNFAHLLQYFTQSGINIEYMYCCSVEHKSVLILRTYNYEAACDVIRRYNLEYVSENDLINLQ